MADATSSYEVVVSESGAPVVRRNIEGIGEGAEKSSKGVDLLNRSLALLGGYLSIAKLISYSDGYQQITNQLKYATHSTQEYMAVEQELFNVSQRTYSSFDSNSKLFQRMVVATSNLGTSYKDLLGFITSVNQAFALSKLSTQEVANSLIQLAQGMSKGILNGDELRTVLESAPILADALARGLNTTVGALRKMGEQGELTTKRVMDAIQKQGPRLQAEFAKLVPTIGQGWQVLTNAIERYIGQTSQATGAGSILSKSFQFLGNNIEGVTKVVGIAIVAWLAYRGALLITAAVSAVSTVVLAMNAAVGASVGVLGVASAALAVLRGALLGLAVATGLNPFTVIVVALTVVIGLIWAFGNAVRVNSTGSISLLGALATAWNLVQIAVSKVIQFLNAVGAAIASNETALNLCKSAVVLLFAAFTLLAAESIIAWFVTAGTAIWRVAAALASTLLWPALIITAFVSIGYILSVLTGTTDFFIQKIKDGYAAVADMATKATADLNKVSGASDLSTGAMQKLLDKSFGAASALGAVKDKAHQTADAHGHLKDSLDAVNHSINSYTQYWGNLFSRFHQWQIETKRWSVTFEEWKAAVDAAARTSALHELIQKQIELGVVSKDYNKDVDYQVGALGRLDEALARAAGSYNYLSKEATNASSSTDSATKAAAAASAGQSQRNAASSPTIHQFTTWQLTQKWDIGKAVQRALEISAQDGTPAAIDMTKLVDMLDRFQKNAFDYTNTAETQQALSKLSSGAKEYLKTSLGPHVVPGFRDGGSFDVGGSGGPDSQLVQFMASPNERVIIEKPEQRRKQDENNGQRPVVVNMTVVTRDSDSFRRSETQTLTSLKTRIRRATG